MGPLQERASHLLFISRRNTTQSRHPQKTLYSTRVEPPPERAKHFFYSSPSGIQPPPRPKKHYLEHEWGSLRGTGRPPFIDLQTEYGQASPQQGLYNTRMGPLQEQASHLFYPSPDGIQPSLAPKKHYMVQEWGLSRSKQATYFVHPHTEYNPTSGPCGLSGASGLSGPPGPGWLS